MKQSEMTAAEAFRHLALDERVKEYILARPELYGPLLRAAAKYIGGEMLDTCLEVAY